jgi:hypothetical protein
VIEREGRGPSDLELGGHVERHRAAGGSIAGCVASGAITTTVTTTATVTTDRVEPNAATSARQHDRDDERAAYGHPTILAVELDTMKEASGLGAMR